jgi:hypothetical protein
MGKPEKSIQRSITTALQQLGFFVSDFSQPRNTMQTPGIPDLFACHPGWRMALWVEVKAGKNKLTDAQKFWHEMAKSSGEHVCTARSLADVTTYLQGIGAPLLG